MKKVDNVIVALDIGTTKICVIVAQYGQNNEVVILGISKVISQGMSRGVISDISLAVYSIKLALKEAELMAGCSIDSVYIGISGTHVQALISDGMVPINNKKVTHEDMENALNAAKAIMLPEGQQILHVLPHYYIVDSGDKVRDPLGMYGIRLEVRAHIITGSIATVQNLVNACHMAGVVVRDIILEPLASACAVLSQDEKELGVGLLDIGGGTSDFVVYQHGTISYTKIFGIAGNHVTHDIALCLRTTIKDAEKIKKLYGVCCRDNRNIDYELKFDVEMVQGEDKQTIEINDLVDVIEPRINELLEKLGNDIKNNNLARLMPAGLVITGGGSLLAGLKDNAEMILNIPVRIGHTNVSIIHKDALSSPIYATGYGLLIYVLNNKANEELNSLSGPLVKRVFSRMKSWVLDLF